MDVHKTDETVELLNLQDLARLLPANRATLHRYIKRGIIVSPFKRGTTPYFTLADVELIRHRIKEKRLGALAGTTPYKSNRSNDGDETNSGKI